jgi:hypothetical protein
MNSITIARMTTRRSFVTAMTSFAGLSVTGFAAQPPAPPAAAEWNMSWLDGFKGKHKQMFDVGSFDLTADTPLRVPMNYLDTFRDVYHLQPPDINVAVGIARTAFPMNASDALWEKYALGEVWGIKDPATGKPATRNIYLGDPAKPREATVRALQLRGAIFWQCNVALGGVAFQLSQIAKVPAPEMRAALIAGLNPGVVLVPAHTMATGLIQERGFTYEKL